MWYGLVGRVAAAELHYTDIRDAQNCLTCTVSEYIGGIYCFGGDMQPTAKVVDA